MKKLIGFLFLSVAWAQPQGGVRQISLDPANTSYHPSRVIVRFRTGAEFLPGAGASHALGANNVHVVDNPPGLSVAEAIRRYQANPNVVYAEADYYVSTQATPTDPLWSYQ